MLKKLDYKILFELDYNARQSYSEIAKKVGASKQVVTYHVSDLIKEGYVKKFLTILDLSKVGLILHKVYLRLTRASAEDEVVILNYLKNHPLVAWLVRTEGIYDIAFALHTKDILELNDMLLDFENRFSNFISEKIVNRVITGEFFHRDYLVEGKQSGFRQDIIFESQEKQSYLDEIDWKILAELSRDARKSVLDISKLVPISADAVGKRIKSLEKKGVIKNYIIVPNNSKLNQLHYKILLKISHFTQSSEKKFLDFCRRHKNVTFYNKNIGTWEVEFDLEIKNPEDFRDIMRSVKKEFADLIKDYLSLIVYDIVKFEFVPMR